MSRKWYETLRHSTHKITALRNSRSKYRRSVVYPSISKCNAKRCSCCKVVKIQFVNIGIELINLPSIFKDKSLISSISTYFENKEFPIICYKYNEPIRSTVFNYNKLVTELGIENSIPDS